VLNFGGLNEFWKDFERLEFLGEFQRRGARVSVPEIGSRAGLLVFGGILGSYADLRRELVGRNFNLTIFGGLLGVPRRIIEEGGRFVFNCAWGNF
jgi:hypothetical protein